VCQFDGRLCDKLYPEDGKPRAVVDEFVRQGLRLQVGISAWVCRQGDKAEQLC